MTKRNDRSDDYEALIAAEEGITVDELREWRLALLHLQGRAGSEPSTIPLARMMQKGKGVPPGIAYSLAGFLDGEGSFEVELATKKSAAHTYRTKRAHNLGDRIRIGEEIIRARDAGATIEEALAQQPTGERTYLMDCYDAARRYHVDPTKYEWVTDREEIARVFQEKIVKKSGRKTGKKRVRAHFKNNAD